MGRRRVLAERRQHRRMGGPSVRTDHSHDLVTQAVFLRPCSDGQFRRGR
jgi:hypothetical protein